MADDLTKKVPAGMSQVEEQALPVAAPVQERHQRESDQASGNAGGRARTLRENADRYVRENPARAVFTALGIGFVCGLIFRR